jgi:hypothetical protein
MTPTTFVTIAKNRLYQLLLCLFPAKIASIQSTVHQHAHIKHPPAHIHPPCQLRLCPVQPQHERLKQLVPRRARLGLGLQRRAVGGHTALAPAQPPLGLLGLLSSSGTGRKRAWLTGGAGAGA